MRTSFEKLLALIISVCLVAALIALPTVAAVSVWDGSSSSASLYGSGTAADPYLIKTAEDLKFFADDVNGGNNYSSKVIYLKNDIDLNDQPFTPIGNTAAYFAGQFDGKNHTISGLNVSVSDKSGAGLFGAVKSSGWIKNLHVEGSVVSTYNAAGPCNIGGLIGNVSSSVVIFNCSFNGLIRSANTEVNRACAGGLIGTLQSASIAATIDHCYVSGVVDAYGHVGGLVASLNSTDDKLNIYNSYCDAVVTGSYAGTSTLDYATGQAGGLIGNTNGTVTFTNCFFAGQAPGYRSTGAAGPIRKTASGTLTCSNVFYDTDKNPANGGTLSIAGVTGVDTDTLTYVTWGYFSTTFDRGNSTVDHPQLRLALMGNGSNDSPYVVDSAADLKLLSYITRTRGVYNFRDDKIIFEADIDLDNVAFTPIGSTNLYFRGNVDGKDHTISNLNINTSSSIGVGLFGVCADNKIKNLNVRGVVSNTMDNSPCFTGGFIGQISGTVTLSHCSFDGTVYSGRTNNPNSAVASGLVSYIMGNLNADHCSVSGTIDGYGGSGGFIGFVNSASYTVIIKNSYCDATVTGIGAYTGANPACGGGLIGEMQNGTVTLKNCFFAGTAPQAQENGRGGPIINNISGGTLTCTNTYYLSDTAVETWGVNKNAAWFASSDAATTLGALFAEGDPHPVFAEIRLEGTGYEESPYLVSSLQDFQSIRTFVNAGDTLEGRSFRLTTDIIMNENYENYATWKDSAPANNWTPIGSYTNKFSGNFDGAGHTIYGMYCSYPSANHEVGTGFFGFTYRGTIKNLHIKDSYVCALGSVGGIAGRSQEATFVNCSFEGYVYGTGTGGNNTGSTGGFIGWVDSGNTIEKCYTAGTVDSYSRTAGIIARADGGNNQIRDCYSLMTVTGQGTQNNTNGSGTGGLVGFNNSSTNAIQNSYFGGTCPMSAANQGPIVGHVNATPVVENCYYVANTTYGGYGDAVTDASELTDGTIVGLLNAGRAEAVWVQGENFPILVLVGDIDRDGAITAGDALLALRHIEAVSLIGDVTLADMDGDGDIDADDYVAIKVAALTGMDVDAGLIPVSVWSNWG